MGGRYAKLALIGWAALLLVLPAVAYAFGARGRSIENRSLATGPRLALGTLFHTGAWHRAGDAFSDHLPWRDRAIRWRAEVGFDIFGDSPNPRVVIVGRDHWLFLHEEFDVCALYPGLTPMQVAQAFELAQAATVATGRQVRTLIIPAKSTIESNRYRRSHYSFEGCARDHERALERLLRGRPGVVDLWSAFRTASEGGHDLWIPNDSHTDTSGSIVLARALVRSLRPSAWQEGLEQSGDAFSYIGDLSLLAGLPIKSSAHRLVLHGAPRNPIRTPALTLGDSQLEHSDPAIRPYLPARIAASINDLLAGAVPRSLIRGARLIIIESVVRTAYTRVWVGFPRQLIDVLLPDFRLLPASYGLKGYTDSSTLKAGGGTTNVSVDAARDDPNRWRLIVVKLLAAPAGANFALLDARGRPLGTVVSARTDLRAGARLALAIPPGVAVRDVRLSVYAPGGATLTPPRIALLGGSRS
jgi:hypothetical protein